MRHLFPVIVSFYKFLRKEKAMEEKQKDLSRRTFLKGAGIAGAAGVGALILPTVPAFADEGDASFDVSEYIPEIPTSDNAAIRKANANALEKWEQAVREARTQRAEICMDQDTQEPNSIASRVTGTSKEVKMWNIPCTIAYCAIFDTADDKSISDVWRANSYARYFGPGIKHISGSWAKTNGQKTLAALFVTEVTWDPGIYPAHTETIATYAEFSADGFVLSC